MNRSAQQQYDDTFSWTDLVQFAIGFVIGLINLEFWLFFIFNIAIVLLWKHRESLLTKLVQTLSGMLGYQIAQTIRNK